MLKLAMVGFLIPLLLVGQQPPEGRQPERDQVLAQQRKAQPKRTRPRQPAPGPGAAEQPPAANQPAADEQAPAAASEAQPGAPSPAAQAPAGAAAVPPQPTQEPQPGPAQDAQPAAPQAAEPVPAGAPPQQPAQPAAGAPAPQQPAAPQQAPAAQQPPAQQPQPAAQTSRGIAFRNIRDANLLEVIDQLARQLGINYILDPAIKGGSVSINTYGTLQQSDLFPLLETILRMNGAVAVKVGNLYQIVPLDGVTQLPIRPQVDAHEELPDDEQMILNAIRLRFLTADDLAKVLEPFLGEGARYSVIVPANMVLVLDNSRNMRRTMDLVRLFDTEEMAKQRMRLFKVENTVASTVSAELEKIYGALALSEGKSAIKFVPIQRISSVLVVSGSATVFDDVEEWIKRLDQPATVGGVQTFVYRVQYGFAPQLASTLLMLYGGGYGGYGGYGGQYGGGYGGGFGYEGGGFGYGGGGYGGGGYGGGGGRGGFGRQRGGIGGFGGGGGAGFIRLPTGMVQTPGGLVQSGAEPLAGEPTDQTGQLLGAEAPLVGDTGTASAIRIVPDYLNNLILVQATQQEWEVIQKTLQQLDFPPRQVLIDAKIYEVALTGAFSSGVSAVLRTRTANQRKLTGGFSSGGAVSLSIGALVGNTRELAAILEASQTEGRTRIISAPSVIATDNIAANITVGTSIPTLSSQAIAGGAQADGSSLFTNTISNVQTGVTLSITPRINASGIVTMLIDQEVSSPLPPAGPIGSPSIDRRNVSTQVTVKDGDTVAIGGIMSESNIYSRSRVPLLGQIPFLGAAFGSTSVSKAKTELVVLLTPRVIYDENELVTMSDELKSRLRVLRRIMRE